MDGDKWFLPCKIYNCAENGGDTVEYFLIKFVAGKDTQLARNKKGSSFLLFSTHLFADPSNAVCRKSDFKLLLTVSLFIV